MLGDMVFNLVFVIPAMFAVFLFGCMVLRIAVAQWYRVFPPKPIREYLRGGATAVGPLDRRPPGGDLPTGPIP
jgi:hypothetical protein